MSTTETLVVIPQAIELTPLVRAIERHGHAIDRVQVGRVAGIEVRGLGLLLAVGGHGKVQLAVQTQHLIERRPGLGTVLCAGAAGSLAKELRLGDVVVATCSVEHDYRRRFVSRPSPRHPVDPTALAELRLAARGLSGDFSVHFGPVASGDEDVVDSVRAGELYDQTGALAVAWEGAGAARAAAFSGIAFTEVRAITDAADQRAPTDFRRSVDLAMPNIAALLIHWRRRRSTALEHNVPPARPPLS